MQIVGLYKHKDDSPLRHFPCIFLKFHGHFFTKLCPRSKKPLPLGLHLRRRHSTVKGYNNWSNAMTSASTMVETTSKSSVTVWTSDGKPWDASSPLYWFSNKEFMCITRTVKHNYILLSSTVRIQLHISVLYVDHLQVEILTYRLVIQDVWGICVGGGDEISLFQ